MTEKTTKRVKMFPAQFEALNFKTQFGAIISGIQSGKTFTGCYWAAKNIEKYPKENGLISAPSYRILQHSTLEKFFKEFPQLREYYKQGKEVIELPTGGKIFVRSADRPLGIEGMTIKWGWLDEYGQVSRLAWTVCRSRVAFTGGQLLITTTPYNLGWLYKEFYKPWKEKTDLEFSVFSWKSIENPYFPRSFYEAEKKRLPEVEFARRYEGKFRRMAGLVYSDFDDSLIVSKKDIAGETIAGVDFGFNNPCAISVIRIDKDNNFYIIDEYYQTEKLQDEINEVALNLQQKYNIRMFYPDPAEPDRIASMKRKGIYVREVNKDITAGIDRVRELMRKRQFYVLDNCINTLDELESYHYPEDEEDKKELPVDKDNHLMDAIRYAIFSYSPIFKKPIQTAEERRFAEMMRKKTKRQSGGYKLKMTQ